MRRFKRILKLGIVCTPFILGVLGYLRIPGIDISSALYKSIRLYSLNTDTDEINLLIEIARWTAPITTLSVILYYAKDLWFKLIYMFRSFKRNSCSVYGENLDATHFLNSLGSDGIKGNIDKPKSSKYHVFFLDRVQDVMEVLDNKLINQLVNNTSKDFQLFFQLPGQIKMAFSKVNIHSFSIEENCSIKYWEEHLSKSKEKIALIGGKTLCEAIIDQGLHLNIFSEDQNIEYHIWSDTKYNKTRKYLVDALGMTGDKLFVYNDCWEDKLSILESMDRIIVCYDDRDNLAIGIKLLYLIPNVKIHIYSNYNVDVDELFDNGRIVCFGKRSDLINREVIIRESLRQTAKKIHLHYRTQYPEMLKWEELSSFHIKSNLSAAGYFKVIEKLYNGGMMIEDLTNLEHIRWCRFHYLQNWKKGVKKDFNNRTHPCLIPFKELSIGEQQKDKENVELALKFSSSI